MAGCERRLSTLFIAIPNLRSKSLFTCHGIHKKSYPVLKKSGLSFATRCKTTLASRMTGRGLVFFVIKPLTVRLAGEFLDLVRV